jgi:hypothetical protein
LGDGLKLLAALLIATAGCSHSNNASGAGALDQQPERPIARERAASESPESHAAPSAEPAVNQASGAVAGGARAGTAPDADGPELSVGGHRVQLRVRDASCLLVSATQRGAPQAIDLELGPPCYILPWNHTRSRGTDPKASSDAVAVGDKGDPMAYRYPSADNAIAIAVIGDPVPDDLWRNLPDTAEQLQARKQTSHCASRLQGVVLTAGGARLSKSWISKRGGAEPRLLCTEAGIDEKDYWLLVHDAKMDGETMDGETGGSDLPPLPERKRKKPLR